MDSVSYEIFDNLAKNVDFSDVDLDTISHSDFRELFKKSGIDFSDISDEYLDSFIEHTGQVHRSGRYQCGSGENPYQHCCDFLGRIEKLKHEGWTETPENIAREFGLNTTQYRTQKSMAKNEKRIVDHARAVTLQERGLGNSEAAREMGISESSYRALLKQSSADRMMEAKNTANILREAVDKKGPVMLGSGVERELKVSREKMAQAVEMLKAEGYEVRGGRVPQATNPNQKTTINVLCPPGSPKNAAYDFDNINTVMDYTSDDGGKTFRKFQYPSSLDSSRLKVRYAEEGGTLKDGLVELKRGVEDISLGDSHYSQVRILVDGTHYIKGMAVYSDPSKFPPGVDVIFNTNKSKELGKLGCLKDASKNLAKDPDNPFGSTIKADGQREYIDDNGNKKLSLINKRADEGDWNDWSNAVPSQFLGKQALPMAKKQLKIAIDDKMDEFNKIQDLTNPVVKKHFLEKFAEECDSASVHLKAAAFPGQGYKVIIPMNFLKDNEVYAPQYETGTKLALVRYPHGGTFEIPILTVNNKIKEARDIIKPDAIDAVGINHVNGARLSGADFDGDTVMCIPTHDPKGKVKVTNRDPLPGLEGFEPKDDYGSVAKTDSNGVKHYYNAKTGREFKVMSNTQTEMGVISNLITDMTLMKANDADLAAAVRHSMVVIDAEKHKLDYKQSEMDNNVAYLKKTYQGGGGASTILSKAGKEVDVPKRQGTPNINQKGKPWYDPDKPEGSLIYKTANDKDLHYNEAKVYSKTKEAPNATVHVAKSGKRYVSFDGDDPENWISIEGKSKLNEGDRVNAKTIQKTRNEKTSMMELTDDAYTLVSKRRTPMEMAYADFANKMKTMANEARKSLIYTKNMQYSPSAKQTYADQVESLMRKLNDAELNSPRERIANVKAAAEVNSKKKSNPGMTGEEIRKIRQQAIEKYRVIYGTKQRKDRNINIDNLEWEAIQAGAISQEKLKRILNNSDPDSLRNLATPKPRNTVTNAQINRIASLQARGKTISEIAKQLNISPSTVSKYLK